MHIMLILDVKIDVNFIDLNLKSFLNTEIIAWLQLKVHMIYDLDVKLLKMLYIKN